MHTWSSGPQQQDKQTILEVFITHLGRRCFFSLKLLLLHLRQSLWCCICPLFDKPCPQVVSTLALIGRQNVHLLAPKEFFLFFASTTAATDLSSRDSDWGIWSSAWAGKIREYSKLIFLGWNPDLGGQRQFFYSFCPGFDWVWWVIFAHLHKVGGEDSNLRRSVKNSSRKIDLQTGKKMVRLTQLAQQALTLPPSLPFHHPSSTSHMKSKFWSTLKWLM